MEWQAYWKTICALLNVFHRAFTNGVKIKPLTSTGPITEYETTSVFASSSTCAQNVCKCKMKLSEIEESNARGSTT